MTPSCTTIRLLVWPAPDLQLRGSLLTVPGLGDHPWVVPVDGAAALQALSGNDIDLAIVAPTLLVDPGWLRGLGQGPAVVLRVPASDALRPVGHWRAAFEAGVQDVLLPTDWQHAGIALRLHGAVWRQHQARQARRAYATDLATGLPHQQQLLEHMNQVLALREREPAPMALLVLRIEGLATTAARLGFDAAAALRRKLAVRLRSGLRASDVVAAIGSDCFAVLLAWIDAPADVEGVSAKLVAAVQRPFNIAGQPVALAVSVGLGRYPEDGKDAAGLLQAALAGAGAQAVQGRVGFANRVERGAVDAANDEVI